MIRMKKKALVLLSGGIDSAVLLWWVKNKQWDCATLSFYFPGRRKGEIKAVQNLRKSAHCKENFDVSLPFVDPPKADQSCYIPQRNLMYYGTAASLADKIQADFILGGHIQHDGKVFRDATPAYFKQLERLIQFTHKRIRLLFPFLTFHKKDVLLLGWKLKMPFEKTWSCARDGSMHCWDCNSCKERLQGFEDTGLNDPLCK
jgi:7-cyano-7-deazaguanine synthase